MTLSQTRLGQSLARSVWVSWDDLRLSRSAVQSGRGLSRRAVGTRWGYARAAFGIGTLGCRRMEALMARHG